MKALITEPSSVIVTDLLGLSPNSVTMALAFAICSGSSVSWVAISNCVEITPRTAETKAVPAVVGIAVDFLALTFFGGTSGSGGFIDPFFGVGFAGTVVGLFEGSGGSVSP